MQTGPGLKLFALAACVLAAWAAQAWWQVRGRV